MNQRRGCPTLRDFRRVGCDTVCGTTGCDCFHFPICGTTLPVQLHHSFFTKSKCPIAAPSPKLRRRHQSPLHRIPMHVPEFFCNFSIRIYVEVIIAPLPKAPTRCLPEFTLGGGPPLKQQPAGNALLQDLHHDRNRTSLCLADQFRANHVPRLSPVFGGRAK